MRRFHWDKFWALDYPDPGWTWSLRVWQSRHQEPRHGLDDGARPGMIVSLDLLSLERHDAHLARKSAEALLASLPINASVLNRAIRGSAKIQLHISARKSSSTNCQYTIQNKQIEPLIFASSPFLLVLILSSLIIIKNRQWCFHYRSNVHRI